MEISGSWILSQQIELAFGQSLQVVLKATRLDKITDREEKKLQIEFWGFLSQRGWDEEEKPAEETEDD